MQQNERLAKFLAHAGIASRRHAEALIASGRVQVNGLVMKTQGVRIDPLHDHVCVDGKPVEAARRHCYLLLNKPLGYISTVFDPQGRPTVFDLLPDNIRQMRLYPIGRLDSDTSGLLLLTNDGDFTLRLSHPRYGKQKHYEVLVQGYLTEEALNVLRTGVVITEENGRAYRTSSADVYLLSQVGNESCLALTLYEGRKRQVRRMLAAVGYPVRQLARVGIGSLTLQGVAIGQWRYLMAAEVDLLMQETMV